MAQCDSCGEHRFFGDLDSNMVCRGCRAANVTCTVCGKHFDPKVSGHEYNCHRMCSERCLSYFRVTIGEPDKQMDMFPVEKKHANQQLKLGIALLGVLALLLTAASLLG
jgi:rubredoxin